MWRLKAQENAVTLDSINIVVDSLINTFLDVNESKTERTFANQLSNTNILKHGRPPAIFGNEMLYFSEHTPEHVPLMTKELNGSRDRLNSMVINDLDVNSSIIPRKEAKKRRQYGTFRK